VRGRSAQNDELRPFRPKKRLPAHSLLLYCSHCGCSCPGQELTDPRASSEGKISLSQWEEQPLGEDRPGLLKPADVIAFHDENSPSPPLQSAGARCS